MARPVRFPDVVNTSPNSTGLGGVRKLSQLDWAFEDAKGGPSKTVSQALGRARTSINPHAEFDFYGNHKPKANLWSPIST